MFIFTAFLLTSHVRLKNQKFVALKPNHERLGNQLYQLASGFGIARKLGRTLYYPLAEGAAENLRCYLSLIQATFPRTGTIYRIIPKHLVEQTSVPFAVDENGKRTCCRYDDPSSYGVESNLNSTLTATKNIAMKKGLSNFLIFGDDQEFMRSLAAKLVDDTMFGHSKVTSYRFAPTTNDRNAVDSDCSRFCVLRND
ncbi:hypothetical protein NECAME_01061 [Necator americanus]|uniref:Uncharacterized protein n=1 Tax=Necator americanus TaxID=51031 RepID=W2SKM8_NECAM|nr:hypothetical protein NECAME_01061 [Necator americanus]ETN70113.1 hypothetical protein NECAME_01061 [Necator americanus]